MRGQVLGLQAEHTVPMGQGKEKEKQEASPLPCQRNVTDLGKEREALFSKGQEKEQSTG